MVDKNRPYAQVLEERTSKGDLLANYTYGHDLLNQKRGLETRYFHYDRLGSTKGLTDENQSVTDSYNYEAFGNPLQVAGITPNHYRFTGEQHDPETGLIYLRARYYDPTIGRFLTQDTWQGQRGKPITLHKYLYANANPVVFIDPTGYMSIGSLMAGVQIRSILTRIWTHIYRRQIKKWLKSKKYHVFKGTQNIPGMSENPEAHHFVYVEKKFQRKGMRFDVRLNKRGMSQAEFEQAKCVIGNALAENQVLNNTYPGMLSIKQTKRVAMITQNPTTRIWGKEARFTEMQRTLWLILTVEPIKMGLTYSLEEKKGQWRCKTWTKFALKMAKIVDKMPWLYP